MPPCPRVRRLAPALALLALLAGLAAGAPTAARAATVIPGGNVVNQTWTPAGSPYLVQGDVTVPAGAFLVIEAGTVVEFAAGDAQAAGLDPTRAELTVLGSLSASGTAGSPVVFQAALGQGRSPGAWHGIVVAPDGFASLFGLVVQDAVVGLSSRVVSTGLLLGEASFLGCSQIGLHLAAGSPFIDGVQASGNGVGVRLDGTAAPTLQRALVVQNLGDGVLVASPAASPEGTPELTASTVHGNLGAGVRLSTGGGAGLFVRNSLVTGNLVGVQRSLGGTLSIFDSDVWGNGTDLSGVVPGPGVFSANPLYVDPPANLRLTRNSPARFGGFAGIDLGARPFAGDPTPVLAGTLWSDTTLTGQQVAEGDLTVAPGVTLTLAAGSDLVFATGDHMASGADAARGELRVLGSLNPLGTGGNRATVRSALLTPGAWLGVLLASADAGAQVRDLTILHAQQGLVIDRAGTTTVRDVVVEQSLGSGIVLARGTVTLDGVIAAGNAHGVEVRGDADAALVNVLLHGNGGDGLHDQGTAAGATSVVNATLADNLLAGLAAAGAEARVVTVRNAIVAGNGTGLARTGGAVVTSTFTDAWNNRTDYAGVTPGLGSLSVDPAFVVPGSDYRLGPASACIDAGTSLGAPATDLAGTPRPQDGDGVAGPQVDLGAYERPAPLCGNGVVEGGEACDDGNASSTDACTAACRIATCGDGFTRAGVEDCDDANASNTDACLTSCRSATCGDGFVQAGVEACDDANTSSTDACLATCRSATCGDGFVQAGVETCDDGNASSTDACLATCQAATCGDGFVQAGVEACDDANALDTDACLTTCQAATCGDGFVQAGAEACDDANRLGGDGCSATCALEVPPGGSPGGCGCGVGGGLDLAALAGLAAALVARRRGRRAGRGPGGGRP